MASAALSVSVAATVADPVTPVVNVVVPQPLKVGVARPAIVNVGSTSAMESAECTSGTFSANVNDTAVLAEVTAFAMLNVLCLNSGVPGTATAVDAVTCTEEISLACASVTAVVRVARSAFCAIGLVVTPVATVTTHRTCDAMSAPPAVSVTFAVAVPDALAAAVKVVLPHPVLLGVGIVPRVNVGSTRSTVSVCLSGALNSNE